MAEPGAIGPNPHTTITAPPEPGDERPCPPSETAAWADAGVLDQRRARALHDSGISPDEVQRHQLGPAIAAGRVPVGEAVTVLRALRRQHQDEARGGVAEPRAHDGAEALRARRDAAFFVRRVTGRTSALMGTVGQ